MVSRKNAKQEDGNLIKSARAAARIAQGASTKNALTAGRKPQAGELFNFRVDPADKQNWAETFNQCGVTLSGGIKLAVYYVIQELKAGRLTMTKAGIIDRRGN